MTREEEITEAAKEYYNPKSSGTPYSLQMRIGFITGAKWADKTMLDRVCERLKSIINVNVPIATNENGEPLADNWINAQLERMKVADKFINEFRQDMEK